MTVNLQTVNLQTVNIWSSSRGRKLLVIFFGLVLLLFIVNFVLVLFNNYKQVSFNSFVSVNRFENVLTITMKENKKHINSNEYSRKYHGTSNLKKPKHDNLPIKEKSELSRYGEEMLDDASKPNLKTEPIRVAFYEGFRGNSWIFERYFRPFYSEISCQCSNDISDVVIKQMVNKRYETRAFDIVVFPYDVTVLRGDKLFWERLHELRRQYKPNQRWVYATRESPIKLQRTLIPTPFTKNSFQWASTYRSNSDFPSPYGYYQKYKEPINEIIITNWASQKSGLVVWMSSNNLTTWRRADFVNTLNAHLQLDIFGKTGKPCGRNSTECEDKIRSYKFYLALENSCCEEYISEKFWRTLKWDCVPIVIGPSKEDYNRVAPPHSFIYADDFASMDDFVRYLRDVDTNDTLYNSFFRWKKEGFVVNSFPDAGNNKHDNNKEPPEELYYSCKKVCEMAHKYRLEIDLATTAKRSYRYFNPRSGKWGGSCGSCGNQTWIKQFQKEES